MATLALDSAGPVAYTDLRTLIDIDPPQYEIEHEDYSEDEQRRTYAAIYAVRTNTVLGHSFRCSKFGDVWKAVTIKLLWKMSEIGGNSIQGSNCRL